MSETDNSEQIVNKPGKPWTNVGVFDSYETAKNQLMHLIAAAPTYDYKIKRSGDRGSKFTIKSRLTQNLIRQIKRWKSLSKIPERKVLIKNLKNLLDKALSL